MVRKKGTVKTMNIALTSMALSHISALNNIGTAVLTMSLDTLETSGDNLVKMMEQSVNPNLGQSVDIKL
ncbi:MAG: putative motility protein [Anaerocolumna sp.]|jgi:hypothetical protein|nr:putative motility protein [Anaerocolumna sp.]